MAASFREKKRHNNKWPVPHRITSDCKLTYIRKTNEWKFSWVYETQKQLCETQADGSVHAVSIDSGVRTPFTWYSPTKGVGKIGQYDIGTNYSPMQAYGQSPFYKGQAGCLYKKK